MRFIRDYLIMGAIIAVTAALLLYGMGETCQRVNFYGKPLVQDNG